MSSWIIVFFLLMIALILYLLIQFSLTDDKTYIRNKEPSTASNATVLIDRFDRRQTQVLSSPSFQFRTNNYNKMSYCSSDNITTIDSQTYTHELKTPRMRRSFSNNNLTSPSYLSFVDKTVVVVAGNEPHQAIDDEEEYRSPSKIFSTLKKRTRFASQEIEIIDKESVSAGPVTPKYSDFVSETCREQQSRYRCYIIRLKNRKFVQNLEVSFLY